MKAAVLEAVNTLVVKDIPVPTPGPSEVLIKVNVCGLCGTDIKLLHGDYSANIPVVLGHEYSGEIAEVGCEVKGLRPGDRVVSDPNESCGACYWCRSGQPCFCGDLAAYGVVRDGGFAEYCTASEKGVYPIPEGLDYDAAAFTEPVSCAVRCIDRAAIRPGDSALIIGAGPMGQILTRLARTAGADPLIVVSRSSWKLQLAKDSGATHTLSARDADIREAANDLTRGIGAAVVIEAVGSPGTVELALRLARKGGRVVIFGFTPQGAKAQFIPFDVLSRELTILGSWVNPYTFPRAIDLLASGSLDVKPLISRRVGLDRLLDAVSWMEEKPEGFMKALVAL